MKRNIAKRIVMFGMAAALLFAGASVKAANAGQQPIAVFVNGRYVASDVSPVLINGRTYIPIRAISEAVGGNQVSWNPATRTAMVDSSRFHMEMGVGRQYISSNGRYFYAEDGVLLIQNRTMVPVRAFANAAGASVEWNAASREVYVTKTNQAVPTAEQVYNSEDLYWLSRIIHAESQGEPLVGKIAVGSVVMNRVKSPDYPNTIHDVIFDTQFGVQFEPVSNGSINNTPSEESVIAAKICLEGYNTAGDSLYFMNLKTAQSKWIKNNRNYYTTIGNHSFYT